MASAEEFVQKCLEELGDEYDRGAEVAPRIRNGTGPAYGNYITTLSKQIIIPKYPWNGKMAWPGSTS